VKVIGLPMNEAQRRKAEIIGLAKETWKRSCPCYRDGMMRLVDAMANLEGVEKAIVEGRHVCLPKT
jgi:hypothetical protein